MNINNDRAQFNSFEVKTNSRAEKMVNDYHSYRNDWIKTIANVVWKWLISFANEMSTFLIFFSHNYSFTNFFFDGKEEVEETGTKKKWIPFLPLTNGHWLMLDKIFFLFRFPLLLWNNKNGNFRNRKNGFSRINVIQSHSCLR